MTLATLKRLKLMLAKISQPEAWMAGAIQDQE
jgi:hypothetical protein